MIEIKLCECGCGRKVNKESNKYVWGHNHRGRTYGEIYGDLASGEKEKRRTPVEGKNREDITGENNPSKRPEVREKIKEGVKRSWSYSGSEKRREKFARTAILKFKGKEISCETKRKIRKTKESNNVWIKEEDLDYFELYQRRVKVFTCISVKEKYSEEELNMRGRDRGCRQIDHIFSVIEGFKQGVLPQIIGSKSNIKLIDAEQNWSKQRRCCIEKDELFKKYEEEVRCRI